MKGDFEGNSMFRQTPDGGMIEAGFGQIISEDGLRCDGFYMKLDDASGSNVAEFAMTSPTFRTLLMLMMETVTHEAKMRLDEKGDGK